MADRAQVVVEALERLGCRNIRVIGRLVKSTCPHEFLHRDAKDAHPSFAVLWDDGVPYGKCLACQLQEPLARTLIREQFARGLELDGFWLMDLAVRDTPLDRQLHQLASTTFPSSAWTGAPAPPDPRNQLRRELARSGPVQPWESLFTLADLQYQPVDAQALAPWQPGVLPVYAAGRGFTTKTAQAWEFGYDERQHRLMLPVRNHLGQLLGWTGRLTIPAHCNQCGQPADARCACGGRAAPKYLHRAGRWRDVVLYGEHLLNPQSRVGILVEGHLDAVAIWQAGVSNGLASQGAAVSDVQLLKLRTWFDHLFVWGDDDEAGELMVETVEQKLGNRLQVHRMVGRRTWDRPLREVIDAKRRKETLVRTPTGVAGSCLQGHGPLRLSADGQRGVCGVCGWTPPVVHDAGDLARRPAVLQELLQASGWRPVLGATPAQVSLDGALKLG